MAPLTRESGHRFLLDVEFLERESFGNGKLPTQKDIVEMMMYFCHPAFFPFRNQATFSS